jgi:hypothetical protein
METRDGDDVQLATAHSCRTGTPAGPVATRSCRTGPPAGLRPQGRPLVVVAAPPPWTTAWPVATRSCRTGTPAGLRPQGRPLVAAAVRYVPLETSALRFLVAQCLRWHTPWRLGLHRAGHASTTRHIIHGIWPDTHVLTKSRVQVGDASHAVHVGFSTPLLLQAGIRCQCPLRAGHCRPPETRAYRLLLPLPARLGRQCRPLAVVAVGGYRM